MPLALFCAIFFLYLPALNNDFVNWDDNVYVYQNQKIQSLDMDFLYWAFTNIFFSNWHPITMISYAIDYSIWGLTPKGYHLTNVLFHSFNTALVFILVSNLITMWRKSFIYNCSNTRHYNIDKNIVITGLTTSLLFGIHPIHVESVAWISERKDVLYTIFFLMSLISYLKYINSRKIFYYCASILYFMLSLMSKPMAVSLPLVLILLDIFPCNRLNDWHLSCKTKWIILEKIPFFILGIVTSTVTLISQTEAISSIEVIPYITRIFVAIKAYMFYLGKMMLPINLMPLYAYPDPDNINLISFEYLIPLACFIFMFVFSFIYRKKNKLFISAWLFFIFTLLPVIGIVHVGSQSAADRYAYVPSLAPFIITGLAINHYLNKLRTKQLHVVFIVSLICITTFFSVLTIRQIEVWRDSETLWSHQIKISPEGSPKPYKNRGSAYANEKIYKEAVRDYDKAIAINPAYTGAYIGRGISYRELFEFRNALKDFGKAMALTSDSYDAYLNRGKTYEKMGDNSGALTDYSKAIEINSSNSTPYKSRGVIYGKIGQPYNAIKEFDLSIELESNDYITYNNRGAAYSHLGEDYKAINDFTMAIKYNSEYGEAYRNRGTVYYKLKNFEKAYEDYIKAVSIDPTDAASYFNLGLVSRKLKKGNSYDYFQLAADLGLTEAKKYLK